MEPYSGGEEISQGYLHSASWSWLVFHATWRRGGHPRPSILFLTESRERAELRDNREIPEPQGDAYVRD